MSVADLEPVGERLLEWVEENRSRYGEGYFERGEGSGYINYSWKPELIDPFINGIIKRSGTQRGGKVLDFGCAKGFYVKKLVGMGYDAIGIDISEYAIAQSPQDVRGKLFLLKERPLELFESSHFSLTIAKDVLEHIPEFGLNYLVKQLKRISRKIFVMVPVCGERHSYINDADEIDETHQIRYTLGEWMKLLDGAVVEPELCRRIKRDKSKGTLCCIVTCERASLG